MSENVPVPTPAVAPEVAAAPAPATPQEQHTHSAEPHQFATNTTDPYLTAVLKQVAPEKVAKPDAPKPEAKPIEPKPAGGLNDLTPDDIENPQVRALGELLLSTAPNLDLNRAIGKAIEYGDPNLIDDAYLKEAGGDRAKALGLLAKQIVEAVAVQSEATTNAIYNDAGGKPSWDAAVALFNKNAEAHVKEVAINLLNSTNHSKIKSGAKFILDYAKNAGGLPTPGVLAGDGGAAAPGGVGLSKEQYLAEIRKVKPEHQNPKFAQEREELFQRRKVGKNQGL